MVGWCEVREGCFEIGTGMVWWCEISVVSACGLCDVGERLSWY